MAIFEYSAVTNFGRLMKGSIEAGSNEEAHQLLSQMQLTVHEINAARHHLPKTPVGRNEFLLFNQQLASITKAKIPLEQGLRELAADAASPSMRKLITEIAAELQAGATIEQAIEKRQALFPPLYVRILRAGLQTGRLSEMLTGMNRHLEIANRTRRIIFEALCYPAVVLALAAVIITFVFMTVIPPMAEVYRDMSQGGARLPALTEWFLRMSEHVAAFWTTVLVFIAAAVIIWIGLGAVSAGRAFKESVILAIPLIGRIYHKGLLARMAETMALLINAGCTMPDCLRLSAGATGSEKIKRESELLAGAIEQGAGIVEAGQVCRLLPRLFVYSIQLGSQRNELEDNLHSLGELYSEQTAGLQSRLQAILLPVMIVFVGGFVGTMVLAMFLPMIRMVTVMM